MPVDDGGTLLFGEKTLPSVPQFRPWYSPFPTARNMRFQIDGAHVHDGDGVLVFERNTGDKAAVDDVRGVETGEAGEVKD